MRRSVVPIPLLSLALLGLVQVGQSPTATAAPSPTTATTSAATAATAAAAAPTRRRTPVAFAAGGYGSFVDGGDVPVQSDFTARAVLACTNYAGLRRDNYVATADLPGLGTVDAVRTRIFTDQNGTGRRAVYSTKTVQEIARVRLVDLGLASVDITGLRSQAAAWRTRSGAFRASTKNSIVGLTVNPAVGPSFALPLPTPGNPVDVLGLATVSLTQPVKKVASSRRASATASSLRVQIPATDTDVVLGNARATISGGVKRGLFGGYSAGVRAGALGGIVKVGRTPTRLMPCQGTNGKIQASSTADVDLGSLLDVGALEAAQRSTSTHRVAQGYELGRVARLAVGSRLKVRGIEGKAFVKRTRRGVVARQASTKIASITLDGRSLTLAPGKVLSIPGLVSLKRQVVSRSRTGLEVVGLRLTLLDGTGATVDLGVGKLNIRPGRTYR